MVASIRELCNCIELSSSTDISIMWDFFGYRRKPPNEISLLKQVQQLLRGRYINLNIIRVGVDQYTESNMSKIAGAIQTAREIYFTVYWGIGRIRYFDLPTTIANGHEIIDNEDEAYELTSEWAVHNHAYDVFLILAFTEGSGGWSNTPGPCDKDDPDALSGVIVSLDEPDYYSNQPPPGQTYIGQNLAHELCHYMGLWENHNPDPQHLMYITSPNGGKLTLADGAHMMLPGCFMKIGC